MSFIPQNSLIHHPIFGDGQVSKVDDPLAFIRFNEDPSRERRVYLAELTMTGQSLKSQQSFTDI